VNRLYGFQSEIFRYSHDSIGFRLVTIPAAGELMMDGMAVVELSPTCQIRNVVQRDSA
jgi:hypothetical protein